MHEKRLPVIAVDGGAASGKSSTSRAVAERFGLLHVDTGLHYRAVTHALCEAEIEADDPDGVATFLNTVAVDSKLNGRQARLRLQGRVAPEEDLRGEAVTARVSRYAAIPFVRNFLLGYQRSMAAFAREEGFAGLIMEGRDIGSVVFPDADLAVFLDADPETRAARRQAEGREDAISQRDKLDATRKTAPLVCPPHAHRIDSSHLSLEGVVEEVCRLIEEKLPLSPVR